MRLRRFLPIAFGAAVVLSTAGFAADNLVSIGSGNTLVTYNSASPGLVAGSVAVTGVASGTTLGAIDYRPASPRLLYAISNTGQLYLINGRTGAAATVGSPALPTISGIGFDFNPTVDRIRVVTQIGQDARINPDSGALVATDGALAYAPGDPSTGQIPTAAGAAYTSNFAGANSTVLYVIDTRGGLAAARLVTQGNVSGTVSPNSGQLFTVGTTGVTTLGSVGFDIARDGTAYATMTSPTTRVTSLYSVNLATGAATLIGPLAGNASHEGLAVQLASFASMGTTPNQQAVGQVLDNFASVSDSAVLALLNGIDSSFATPGAQAAALQALSPASFSQLPEVSLNVVETQETNVLRYARDLRGAAGDAPDIGAGGRIGLWAVGGARFGRYDGAVDRPRAQADETHVLAGVDYRFAPAIAVGAYGGYGHVKADLAPNGGARGALDSWHAGAYGTAAVGPIYLDAWGSYTDLDWSLRRGFAFGSFTGGTTADTDGRIYAGGASTGLRFEVGPAEIEPFVAGRYANVRIDGFTEAGSAAALRVGSVERISIRSNAGARLGGRFPVGGAVVRPQVRASWYHEFRDQPRRINAAFVNGGIGTPFGFVTTPLSNDYFNLGAALNIVGSGPLSMVADYDVQLDDDRQFHALSLAVRVAL